MKRVQLTAALLWGSIVSAVWVVAMRFTSDWHSRSAGDLLGNAAIWFLIGAVVAYRLARTRAVARRREMDAALTHRQSNDEFTTDHRSSRNPTSDEPLFEYPDGVHDTDVEALASCLAGLGEQLEWVLINFQGGGDGIQMREIEYRDGRLRASDESDPSTQLPDDYNSEHGFAVLGKTDWRRDPGRLAQAIHDFVRLRLELPPYDDGNCAYFSFGVERLP